MTQESTGFEPIGRAPEHEVLRQMARVGSDLLMTSVADGAASFISILNPQRQIVYANRTLREAFGVDDGGAIGLRPGELFGCRNVDAGPDGCGTSTNCSTCGAARAIKMARLGSAHREECRILREDGEPLDLEVKATPTTFDGDQYILFSAVDISDAKRRQSLERIFFHDLMNTATGVRGLSSLARSAGSNERDELLALLEETSGHLVDEIEGQRQLLAAEKNELAVHPETIDATRFLQSVAAVYEAHQVGEGKTVRVASGDAGLEVVSDPTLLGRVVGNLIKNALEATPVGGSIAVWCGREGARVIFTVHNAGEIPRSSQAQIFQRSFTTKGEGRGLGTYGSKLLIDRYLNGRIGFESTAESGTTFAVSLPA